MDEKILIVEDNPQNMRLIEMTLRSQRLSLLKATDGEQALKMAINEKPDLIIMDMRLPRMDGFEVTKKLRTMARFTNTPILGLTAYAMNGDEGRVIACGCDAYLSKPIDTRELPRVITQMLAEKRSRIRRHHDSEENPGH